MQLIWRTGIAAVCLATLSTASLVCTSPAQAWTLRTLYRFTGGRDGDGPNGGLVRDNKTGDLYGTTLFGGAHGRGTVFKVSPDETETVLYNFTGAADSEPRAGLVRDSTGNLYGTACCGQQNGMVFKLTPDGIFTVLHAFNFDDGAGPEAVLLRNAATGVLYGTTSYGGADNCGTVFKLTADGAFTSLHTFTGGKDGCAPNFSGVTMDSAENLYGATTEGGLNGEGVIYKLAPNGKENVLHQFGAKDGTYPDGGVALDTLANLYGTTSFGGAKDGGVVFEIAPDKSYKILHNFTGGDDGLNPRGNLILERSGAIYGSTLVGGPGGYGVVYGLKPRGGEKMLATFDQTSGSPQGSLIQDKVGNLYGTTGGDENGSFGTVFELVK